MAQQLELRLLPIDELRPAPYNPRTPLQPGDAAYDKLEASLRQFGLVEPLVWNATTGYVVGGHARLAILRRLGVTAVPVSVVRLAPAHEKALNVVLNNREAQGRFAPARLAELLAELAEQAVLDLTGFDAADLAALRLEPAPAPAAPAAASARVEITLVAEAAVYEQVAARLDALIAEFDLTSHVRRA
jgi:ParB-like chromosome segregation protein Spo0J